MKATGSRPAPGASGEFGSHAIRPRSSHHMQVMTVVVEATQKFPRHYMQVTE
jgi:quercetin dioxygenase-like cupin family protein